MLNRKTNLYYLGTKTDILNPMDADGTNGFVIRCTEEEYNNLVGLIQYIQEQCEWEQVQKLYNNNVNLVVENGQLKRDLELSQKKLSELKEEVSYPLWKKYPAKKFAEWFQDQIFDGEYVYEEGKDVEDAVLLIKYKEDK